MPTSNKSPLSRLKNLLSTRDVESNTVSQYYFGALYHLRLKSMETFIIISHHFTQARGPKCLPFKWFKCSVTQKRTLHKIPEPKRFSCRFPKQLRLQTCFRACLLFTRLLSIYLLFTISGCSLGIGDQRILWLMINSLWLFFTQMWSSFKNILPYNTPFYNY